MINERTMPVRCDEKTSLRKGPPNGNVNGKGEEERRRSEETDGQTETAWRAEAVSVWCHTSHSTTTTLPAGA